MNIHSHVDHHGNVEIKFNLQEAALAAPGGKKYLPCSACMKLEVVEMNVVSTLCDSCDEISKSQGLTYCEDCRHWVKPVYFDNTREQCRWVPSYADETGEGFESVRVGEVGDKCPCCGAVLDFSFID